ncbi:MAG TPA: bifunctional shikimate kinase/3-dehydroquinate synthase [Candidatus Limnocylindria bacterium]|nr:bifunctional shikimate kinase/3-dehydroquinate synthase [Candidatus Limnocylindria bacterium]
MPDGVVLIGLSGSGKSTVGRIVAERLGRPFLDTDDLIAQRIREPAAGYLRRAGEPAFREAEARAVDEAVRQPGAVIAAGGGAPDDPLNRWQLWSHGTVVWLHAPDEVLLARLARDRQPRPMLAGDPAARLAQLDAQRSPFLRAADLETDAAAPSERVANAILECVRRQTPGGRRLFDADVARRHPIGPTTTRIVMGLDLDRVAIHEALGAVQHPGPSIVVDRAVAERHLSLMATLPAGRCLAIRGGERAKRLRRLEELLEWLSAGGAERRAPLIAVGGGTVGDLAGTAAALYARGIPLVHVPTTWLAQADSAFGGKVAIDLAGAKNAAGVFWPPAAVIVDVATLRTQTVARRRDGMAESLKAALIGDPILWKLIGRRGAAALRTDEAARYAIVEQAARLKLAICERDPFESDERRALNLGHTIGHALEVESRYRLSHGIAVALGLRAVAAIAAGRGADPELSPALDGLLATLGFPQRRAFEPRAVRDAIRGDKKRTHGRQRWILPMAIGEVTEVDDVTDAELERALRAIWAQAQP